MAAVFGYGKRINLESYIIHLLLDDTIREEHKRNFQEWIRETEAEDAVELGLRAHYAIQGIAERLAKSGSLLTADALIWDCKKRAQVKATHSQGEH